ncbi:hypothetical protein [Bradyrhizobium elkanii]|uniref:hypothetical protein n=1 Tax=Bradyrhizobium elkanii TaxID=29448 RepID=UPI0035144109
MSVGREHRPGSMPFRSGCLRAYFYFSRNVADHFAGRQVDAMQRANGAELLADALHLQDC